MKRVVNVFAVLSTPDPVSDEELKRIAEDAIYNCDLDIEECRVEIVEQE